MEDLQTAFVGRFGGGKQFLLTEASVRPHRHTEGSDREGTEYVVLYLFNSEGELIDHHHSAPLGSEAWTEAHAQAERTRLLALLDDCSFGDIVIQPFRLEIDGHVFGLIADSEQDIVHLEPGSSITFMEPWDGEYHT
jgi:hypothetical protein